MRNAKFLHGLGAIDGMIKARITYIFRVIPFLK